MVVVLRRALALVSAVLLALLVLTPTGAAQAAVGSSIEDFSQCTNGAGGASCTGWTNGILNASNSTYREDGVTPQRLVMNFAIPGVHVIQLSYLTLTGSNHAYDSLATWNHTQTAADRCQDLSAALCVGGPASTFPIPLDPAVVNPVGVGISNVTSAHQLSGQRMELYGGTLAGILGQPHGTFAPDYGSVLVTMVTTVVNANVMLLFGGHVAAGLGVRGWAEGLGAGEVPGGNYHIRVTELDGASVGSRDNQIMAGAIKLNDTTIATTAAAGGVVGDPIKDRATISGATADAGGSITFKLYGPVATDVPTCVAPAVFTDTVTVTPGVSTYDSASYTALQPGYYFWIASYSGDVGNRASTGTCGATGETTLVVKNTPGLFTAATTPVQIGATISDTAHLTGLIGTPTAAQVTFRVYADTGCLTPLTVSPLAATGPVPDGGDWVFTAASYTPTAVGSYYWRAFYAGDALNLPISGACQSANETSVVARRQPSLVTQATATTPVGSAITDQATVSGVYGPLLSTDVTFMLYSDPQCAVPVALGTIASDPATLSQSGQTWTLTSNSITPATAGTYFWRAFFAGNVNNEPTSGACGDVSESSVVTPAVPTVATVATPSAVIGSPLTDIATISGVYGPLTPAQVSFRLYSDATCATAVGAAIGSASATVAGTTWTVTSDPVSPTAVGAYFWRVFYAGDLNNAPTAGACNDANESSFVTKSQPAISTSATRTAPILGVQLTDIASLTGVNGAVLPSELTFKLYAVDTCAEPAVATVAGVSVALIDATWVVVSAIVTPATAGSYYWRAFYSGNATNLPVSGACLDPNETSTVTKAAPVLSTTATPVIPVGGSITDVAHLSSFAGTPLPSELSFAVYDNANCAGTPTSVVGAAVSAAGSTVWDVTSQPVPVSAAGDYYWIASFAGNANNDPVTGACGDVNEASTVSRLAPQIATSATATVVVGASASDTALLTGVFAGTTVAPSQLNFTVFADDHCGTVLGSVAGATATKVNGLWQVVSQPFTTTSAGTVYWRASYAGDANNLPTEGGCSDVSEQTTVTPRAPLISTATVPTALVGAEVTDTAYLSDVFGPVLPSEVTFVLYSDVGCTQAEGSTVGVIASGTNGTWDVTSGPVTPAHAGTYHWIATYAGNADNLPAVGICSDPTETVTVVPRRPAISTLATSSAAVGGAIRDVATLTGVSGPVTSDQVHFALHFGPGCDGPAVAVAAATVSSDGETWTVTSADHVTPAAGSYRWIATYDGNADNVRVAGVCGDVGETSVVTRRAPGLVTAADGSVSVGGGVSDVATLSGVFGAVVPGDVSFTVFDNAGCAGAGVTVPGASLVGTQVGSTWVVRSAPFVASHAGTVYWVASWPGNANNDPVAGACSDPNEQSTVIRATPAIATTAVVSATVGEPIRDVATVSGVFGPLTASQVHFLLYSGTDCTGPAIAVAAESVSAAGSTWTVTSAAAGTVNAGAYRWVASYDGNADNDPVSGACGDVGESSTVQRARPALDTVADVSAVVGSAITDSARLSGLAAGTTVLPASVSFAVFSDPTCQTRVGTVPGEVLLAGTGGIRVGSAPYTPSTAGNYYWIASYTGDANNAPATGACGDDNESTTITARQPHITTQATAQAGLGSAVSDTATITGLYGTPPAGTVSFAIYSQADCSGEALFTAAERPLVAGADGAWTATSGGFIPLAPGAFNWVASYSGDADNSPVAGVCGDAGETSMVGDLVVVKAVDQTSANYGDQLTYTLTGSAFAVDQTGVVITDTVPAGTTYVSSACAAPCASSYEAATKTVTWKVGVLAAGTSVSVTFVVRIDTPSTPAGDVAETVIDNVGAIASEQTPSVPSNLVRTVVPRVLPVVVVRPPPPEAAQRPAVLGAAHTLPETGLPISLRLQVPLGLVLIGVGVGALFVTRPRSSRRRPVIRAR